MVRRIKEFIKQCVLEALAEHEANKRLVKSLNEMVSQEPMGDETEVEFDARTFNEWIYGEDE